MTNEELQTAIDRVSGVMKGLSWFHPAWAPIHAHFIELCAAQGLRAQRLEPCDKLVCAPAAACRGCTELRGALQAIGDMKNFIDPKTAQDATYLNSVIDAMGNAAQFALQETK